MPIGMCPRCGMPLGKPHSFPCCNDPKPLAADRSTRSPAAREEVDSWVFSPKIEAALFDKPEALSEFYAARQAALATRATAATREGSACVACEGSPKAPNNPCAVCGAAQSAQAALEGTCTHPCGDMACAVSCRKRPALEGTVEGLAEECKDLLDEFGRELSCEGHNGWHRSRPSEEVKASITAAIDRLAALASRSASDARAVPMVKMTHCSTCANRDKGIAEHPCCVCNKDANGEWTHWLSAAPTGEGGER